MFPLCSSLAALGLIAILDFPRVALYHSKLYHIAVDICVCIMMLLNIFPLSAFLWNMLTRAQTVLEIGSTYVDISYLRVES